MLPLQQAIEVKQSIIEYIKATFHFKEESVHDAFYQFIESQENGIIQGPYLSLKTPFVKSAASHQSHYSLPDECFDHRSSQTSGRSHL